MAKKQKKKILIPVLDNELFLNVRHALEHQGTSFNAYCKNKNIDRRNARRAVIGESTFKKALILKQQILRDAKLTKPKKTTIPQPTQDTRHANPND